MMVFADSEFGTSYRDSEPGQHSGHRGSAECGVQGIWVCLDQVPYEVFPLPRKTSAAMARGL